jgi:hypothetical protein
LKKKEGCTISRTLLQFEYCFSKKGKEGKEKIYLKLKEVPPYIGYTKTPPCYVTDLNYVPWFDYPHFLKKNMIGGSQANAAMDDGLEPGPSGRTRHLLAAPSSRYAAGHVSRILCTQ